MNNEKCMPRHGWHKRGGGDMVYVMGMVGAMVYFVPQAVSFTEKLWAIGKALVWPAIAVFQLLTFLKA